MKHEAAPLILNVDDDPGGRYVISRVLRHAGYRVAEATTVAEARHLIADLRPGLVLLDATAGSDAGIDVVSSPYATVAAEQTALERLARVVADQIVARLALYASSRPIGQ